MVDGDSGSNARALLKVRVSLENSKPLIWRLLEVEADTRLDDMHLVLQRAFGWRDAHGHRFTTVNPLLGPGQGPAHCIDWLSEGQVNAAPRPPHEDTHEGHDVHLRNYDWHRRSGKFLSRPGLDRVGEDAAALRVVREAPRRLHPQVEPITQPPHTPPPHAAFSGKFAAKFADRTDEVRARLEGGAGSDASVAGLAPHPSSGGPDASGGPGGLAGSAGPDLSAGSGGSDHLPRSAPTLTTCERRVETTATLGQALAEANGLLFYEYDFDDQWVHRIHLEESRSGALLGSGRSPAWVVSGDRSGPLEDSGGIDNYHDLLATLNEPGPLLAGSSASQRTQQGHDMTELLAWATGATDPWRKFNPTDFDVTHANREIKRIFVRPGNEAPSEGGIALLATRMMPGIQPEFRARLERVELGAPGLLTTDAALRIVGPLLYLVNGVGTEGMRLTSADYLPPAFVARALRDLELGARSGYPRPPARARPEREPDATVAALPGVWPEPVVGGAATSASQGAPETVTGAGAVEDEPAVEVTAPTVTGDKPAGATEAAGAGLSERDERVRESLAGPFGLARGMCEQLGLVQRQGHVLRRTELGERVLRDPMHLWQLLVGNVVGLFEQQVERDAAMLLLLEVAVQEHRDVDSYLLSLRFGLQMLGWTSKNSWDLDFAVVRSMARPLVDTLVLLGVIALEPEPFAGGQDRVRVRVTKVGAVFARSALAQIRREDVLPPDGV
ncbi:hypothetical protein JT358_00835 [Micrococcales bacterium 31B]|nr:hypothetical protein [Micrococcales bacterium 31B]